MNRSYKSPEVLLTGERLVEKEKKKMEHKGTVLLETGRLVLRKFTTDDAEAMYTNWASDPEVTKFLTWNPHVSVEASRWFIQFCLDEYEKDSTYQWGIELKESNELIGSISVVKVQDEIDALELGWCIGRKFWGNGYTAEAAKRTIEFLFDEVHANRIAARHDVNNPNLGRVMQKAGMKYEGTLRASDINNQGICDCTYYSILSVER